jgi:hypothetical protein
VVSVKIGFVEAKRTKNETWFGRTPFETLFILQTEILKTLELNFKMQSPSTSSRNFESVPYPTYSGSVTESTASLATVEDDSKDTTMVVPRSTNALLVKVCGAQGGMCIGVCMET